MGQPKLEDTARKAVAIVGVGAVMPDAPDAAAFWQNIKDGRSSIREIPSEGYWEPALYYDPDPSAPDKSYTTIGGFATNWAWEPLKWKLPIPPKVSDQMDRGQKWAIMSARQALMDYGLDRPLDRERTGVILGNAMAGDLHYYTATRILTPEIIRELQRAPSFQSLPADLQARITEEVFKNVQAHMPPVNEDTMPGELSNIIAGRVAAMFNLNGPNFVTDAACASAMAAVSAACEGLTEHRYDAVLSGGVDANMNPSSFIKFCKIGALSATGSRPFDKDADGFVMGEGAALFLMKRLADAERDGDKIYAVIRGIGGSSDGKGKGITAPNPAGQQYAVARGWENAGLAPDKGTYIEGHGTSTRVGDVAEGDSLIVALKRFSHLERGDVALGSVKSNIGHLKAGAGAAGLFKAALSLHEKVLPPSLNFNTPNPKIDFANAPFYVNDTFREWDKRGAETRKAAVSSFGFGGTNFHVVMEEYVPGRLQVREPVVSVPGAGASGGGFVAQAASVKAPLRGALVLAGATRDEVLSKAKQALADAEAGKAPEKVPPKAEDLRAEHRLVIDFGDAAELAKKLAGAVRALGGADAMWKALKAQGIFYRSGEAPKVAFLYTGQGSQYVNMMRQLRDAEPIVRQVFEDADATMTPLLGKPLTDYIYVDPGDEAAVKQATMDLMQTAITQPAVLATDQSLTKLMAAYGIEPDMVMGHSLGEYGALVASGALPFADALEAVSARGREMTKVSVEDCGLMAAVFAPIEEVQEIIDGVDGYCVIANINSGKQAVIGGSTPGVKAAVEAIEGRGYTARMLPVSHAFHTSIVAPASGPLQEVLRRLDIRPPQVPLVANTTGDFYPMHPGVESEIVDILGEQIASPVQFVKGLHTLYEAGCRVFVEMGPKKALHGFVEDVLGEHADVLALFSNHPKQGDIVAFNQALCGLYAAGLGIGEQEQAVVAPQPAAQPTSQAVVPAPRAASPIPATTAPPATLAPAPGATSPIPAQGASQLSSGQYQELGQIFAEFIDKGLRAYAGGGGGRRPLQSVVITGAAVGLPGLEKVFDDRNVERLLSGQQLIGSVPPHLRQSQIDKRIVRLVKDPITGSGKFVTLDDTSESIKLGGRIGTIDLPGEFGYPKDRMGALDVATELVIGAGIQALRDAGIPLVRTYKKTSKGTFLPDRWMLPESMRDETGVIFGSAFPGYEAYADEMRRYYEDHERRALLAELEQLRARIGASLDLDARIEALRAEIADKEFNFDRRFVFKILAMGHSQFAEYIGARGPNTQINAACASGTQGIGLAQDWIQSGRCRRVIVISSDSVTSDNLMEWIGSGFLASGAAATDEVVEEAALPFDRRRHGLLLGAGGAAVVVESAEAAAERGVRPVSELLETSIANSAFHGSRLDVQHVAGVIEALVARAERRWGVSRDEIADQMVFVSHETFTPARGGSAQAEVNALRQVFGAKMDKVVVANTKGLTGHAMGTGIEDVLAVKALETGVVPPVPNFKEVDPELGTLNLAKGGSYPIHYALRLAAGFGSQVSITLQRWIPSPDGRRPTPQQLGFTYRTDQAVWSQWLSEVTGYDNPELEVIKHTLRVKEQGPPKRAPKAARPLDDIGAAVPAASVGAPAPRQVAAPAPRPVVSAPKPAPAPVAAAPAPAPAPAPAAPTVDPVVQQVLGIIAEQTGYPTDMLDMELDLEADLGIDTVKQAETFAAVREAYNIERNDNIQLRDFPTIKHVVEFVRSNRPDLAAAAPVAAPAPAAAAPAAPAVDPIVERVLSIIAEQTGYPPDMLDMELDLEADLGIDTVKQAETFAAVREAYDISREENIQLRDFPTIKHVVDFVRGKRPDLAAEAAKAVAAAPVAPAAPAAAPAPTTNPVADKVIAIVAEQTGYPPDMLDMDLDLEADLGIDTVKQAETFAAVREAFSIERVENMQLRDFPTMKHVVQFVFDHKPELAAEIQAAAAAAAAAPAPAAAPVAAATVAAAPAQDEVTTKVIAIIAEQTGYPEDMLDLDLDLEADLGIDTVKQAETFAAVREAFGIERVENLQLRDFPTMKHVIGFVYDHRPDLKEAAAAAAAAPVPVAAAAPVAAAPVAAAPAQDEVTSKVIAIIAEQTGYPEDMLDLDLDLEADLGIDTVKQAETFAAVREAFGIERVENLQLRDFPTMKHVIGFVYDHRPDLQPTAAPTAAPSAEAPAAAAPAHDAVTAKVVSIIAEQTGYPEDMLDLELDLEADLGIDTVKQAETFAAVREAFGIEKVENLQLRDFPTMKHVIGFVYDHKPELREAVAAPAAGAPAAAATSAASTVMRGSMEAAASIPRRVPVPFLRPPLSLCKPTGVELGAGKRVVVMHDDGGVGEALVRALEQREVSVLQISDRPAADELTARIEGWIGEGAVDGVYWLTGLDPHADFTTLDYDAFKEAIRVRVKLLYTTMRALYEQVDGAAKFLVSGVRLGGQHGYDEDGAALPLGGAVTGFTKAYKRERDTTLVKAVDFGVDTDAETIAEALIAETLADPGVVEIGHVMHEGRDGDRWTVGLRELALDEPEGIELDGESVFIVTGAAGSIVSAITGDLAEAAPGTFYLLDLTPEPDPENDDLRRFVSDKDGLKRDIFERIKAGGERATPKMVDRQLAGLERQQSALAAIEAVRAAGGTPEYRSLNLMDGEAIAKVVDEIREKHGRVDVLLHAAGLEISRFLPDKKPEEFDLVFDVKADGWFHLLHAIGDMPLKATVSFSSIAGRFGNGGQTDYSSANDLLCKTSSSFRTLRPQTRGVAVDWTAWGGIGMAARGSIPKMMELARIDMLPPEAGIPMVRRELTFAPSGTEIVVAQGLGIMLEEFDATGGLDADSINATPTTSGDGQRPMAAHVVGMGLYGGLTVETELDPEEQPFLYDHQIDGTPVLPGVMGIEAFGELAKVLFPDWHVAAVEDVTFLAPFKFYRNQRRKLELQANFSRVADGELVADCLLVGKRNLPNSEEPVVTKHFAARVRLLQNPLPAETIDVPKAADGPEVVSQDIYQVYFHGPAYQVIEKAWRSNGSVVGLLPQELPEDQKPEARQEMLPRLIELCFQTAGLWEIGTTGKMGLPNRVEQVSVLRDLREAEGRVFSVVTPREDGKTFDAIVADEAGHVFVKLGGYRTVELPGGVDEEKRKPLKSAME